MHSQVHPQRHLGNREPYREIIEGKTKYDRHGKTSKTGSAKCLANGDRERLGGDPCR
jgi:hypothetical protein